LPHSLVGVPDASEELDIGALLDDDDSLEDDSLDDEALTVDALVVASVPSAGPANAGLSSRHPATTSMAEHMEALARHHRTQPEW
jgi:hypothetical protein